MFRVCVIGTIYACCGSVARRSRIPTISINEKKSRTQKDGSNEASITV